MTVTYKFHIDKKYFQTLIERYDRQRPMFLRLYGQFGALAVLGSFLYIFFPKSSDGISSDAIATGVLLGLVVCVGGVQLTKWGILLRYQRRADFGIQVAVVISEEGVVAYGEHTQGTWQWPAYPRAVRFSDGIMLMRTGVIRWLPDAAIQGGTVDEAIAVVKAKAQLRFVN